MLQVYVVLGVLICPYTAKCYQLSDWVCDSIRYTIYVRNNVSAEQDPIFVSSFRMESDALHHTYAEK